jgi:predicted glycosyltransferase involved in capsule biosynthesis
MSIKLSVIIAVLDSHEIVKRQLLHFDKMNLSKEDIEFIIVDDGSKPPLGIWLFDNMQLVENSDELNLNLIIHATDDERKWSQPCARNAGAKIANSDRLLMTDIDHVLSKESLLFCMESDEDKVMFPRQWAILDHLGYINQNPTALYEYGLPQAIYEQRRLNGGMHHNTFMIKKSLFRKLGGYNESFCGKYGGDDTDFSYRYSQLHQKGEAKRHVLGPSIYVFPDPNRDVKKIFHNLRR